MYYARPVARFVVLIIALTLGAYLFALVTSAQNAATKHFRPDLRRALAAGTRNAKATLDARPGRYVPQRGELSAQSERPRANSRGAGGNERDGRRPLATTALRPGVASKNAPAAVGEDALARSALDTRIRPGTSPGRILHTSQLSTTSAAGSLEQFTDADLDLEADERATFDACGGAFDVAVGHSGARYQVYTAFDDRDTPGTADDRPIGVLSLGFDSNLDFQRDNACAGFAAPTHDLYSRFGLPSAVSVVAGASRQGREFVVVSSSGYYNYSDPADPDNEPTAGVVLVAFNLSGGIDFSRVLVAPGSGRINNANALALLPTGELLIADFDSGELRIVRDNDRDGTPDTLDPTPYYSYQFSDDAPLDIAANSRGVVFSHSTGNNAVMLALYDTNANGFADAEEVVVEGLSLDDNLILHGLAVDREGTVYVVEDAMGASDASGDGGNGGTPLIDAFPDPALNGVLRDGALYVAADNPRSQALTGLAFGTDTALRPVGTLSLTNSASMRGNATRDGLGTISGASLTGGRRGASAAEAVRRGVRVTIEGASVPVHSFADNQINIYVPDSTGTGARSVVVSVDGRTIAAEDVVIVNANPGLFTSNGTGAGEAVALLASGLRYTRSPFPARFDNQPSVITLFGTGWRRGAPVTATVGGRAVVVEYAGACDGFPGLDQINLRLPDNTTSGTPSVVLRTTDGAVSRNDVVITVN
ncbi:MAG TPA: IPT/TIG domain-containing protein [Pyrinomonadaceae bacterium]|nr:IPT/TIG domain-containing protein [Pyrinomonadaceae bacterium]